MYLYKFCIYKYKQLKKNINLPIIEKSINPKLKPVSPRASEWATSTKGTKIWPSYEHTQGIKPGLITGDPSALTKVRPSTQEINFRMLGGGKFSQRKLGPYTLIKEALKEAEANLKLKLFGF